MRFAAITLILSTMVLFQATVQAGEEEKPDPETLLTKFVDKSIDAKTRGAISGQLAGLGDVAIKPIMKTLSEPGLQPLQLSALVQILGQIGTPAALMELKRITRMKGAAGMQALRAISSMNTKQAHEFLLSFKPSDNDTAQFLVRSLMNVPGRKAIERLAGALISSNAGVSARARQILEKRLEKDGSDYRAPLDTNVRKLIALEQARKPRPPHAVKNILKIAAALPRGDGSDMFARCLEDTESGISVTAFTVLQSNPKMAVNPDVRESLKLKLTTNKDDAKLCAAIMDVLRKAGDIEALPIIASQLTSKDQKTAYKATDVMRAMTGENLGRNPIRWSKWYEEKGQETITRIRSKARRSY